MNRIARLPCYTINSEIINKEQVSFGDNVKGKLELFADAHLPQTKLLIGYHTFEIKVFGVNLTDWTEEKHKAFCWNFHALLYAVEIRERKTKKEQKFDVIYTYIPKFVKEKDNNEFSLDWSYVQALANP